MEINYSRDQKELMNLLESNFLNDNLLALRTNMFCKLIQIFETVAN